MSISEPEVLLPFVAGSTLTKADPREGEERSKLLRACIEVLCVTTINRKLKDGVKNISYVVIKPKVRSKFEISDIMSKGDVIATVNVSRPTQSG